MESKHKNILIAGLVAIVLLMAIGYAAFATQLTINGTANINSNWDVHIETITPGDPVGTATNTSATVDEGNLTATFQADLKAPGDTITYDVKVVNTGTLDAKLDAITFNQTNHGTGVVDAEAGEPVDNDGTSPDTVDNAIIYSYSDLEVGEVLDANNGEKTFKVTVTYNSKLTDQPDPKQLTSKLTMTLTYVQNKD